ncbi:MAG: divalent metal cation transporter [Planctomycetaceae bacterium]|nr:divalent metal cation transporter [Planctomycetaceae bacterium]
MSAGENRLEEERAQLVAAHQEGLSSVLKTYVRLSGPGWLQSAITLGGGSLAGALFLGILGGTSLLWLQLVAIVMGVIMLSAISYVTLSTGERPFRSINQHINPALGWGWIIATILANMIFCMPQFSLCFTALQRNLIPGVIDDSQNGKILMSTILLVAAGVAVMMNSRQGRSAKLFDMLLKALVGIVVICFAGVVGLMAVKGQLNWDAIFKGFIPDLSQWSRPTGDLAELIATLPAEVQGFWTNKVVESQRAVMIGAAATAVGINMTFLMPYSMLRRGWDQNFRGLARFDLSTGMAIPYIVVTSCVVIAAASQFHAQADPEFLSSDPTTVMSSSLFKGAAKVVLDRPGFLETSSAPSETDVAAAMAQLSTEERLVASSVVQRDAFELSKALAPLLGEKVAQVAFGLGVFGMGFSTIIILMLINGFAFCEIADKPMGGPWYVVGSLVAGISGASWWYFWQGDSKVYLAIIVSAFAIMLLPIAYTTFFMMMNSRRLLGDAKPTGLRAVVWNLLMGISVAGAFAAAGTAMMEKARDPKAGTLVIGLAAAYGVAVVLGFFRKTDDEATTSAT